MKHTEFETLVKGFEGSLSLSEEREAAEHLAECETCAALRRKLESFFSYANAGRDLQISRADAARLLNIFQPRKIVSARSESIVQRLAASLVFDDWQTALNERFAAGDSRHLLYRAGRFEIDLRLEFSGGKCRASGQIFPDCGKDATARIFSEKASEKVSVNDYCEFVFPPVAQGVYNFRFDLAGNVVEIENISLLG